MSVQIEDGRVVPNADDHPGDLFVEYGKASVVGGSPGLRAGEEVRAAGSRARFGGDVR